MVRLLRLARFGFLILFAAIANAGEIRSLSITAVTRDAVSTPAVVSAAARRIDGVTHARSEFQLTPGVPAEVPLGEGMWEITVTSPEWWAAPLYSSASDGAITLPLWRRGSIHGTIGTSGPRSAELIVNFSAAQAEAAAMPAGVTVCRIEERQWNCPLPAGTHDLRLSVGGFATEFRWGVQVRPDTATPMGRLDFTPGSSIFGTLQLRGGQRDELQTAEVAVVPANPDLRVKNRRYTARPNERGFFQVRGLAPGEYVLRAETKELISEPRTVEIIRGTNASLREPLLLAKPARISVSITPPIDDDRKRWQVSLLRKEEGAFRTETIDRSLATTEGQWSSSRIAPGEYYLEVGQEDGSEWKTETLQIRSGDTDITLDVRLTPIRVTGTVRLGDRPIAARVRFGGEHGRALMADERGEFSGIIPPPDDGKATIVVAADTPHIQRSLQVEGERKDDGALHFDIRLPSTAILGRIVNEDGTPEPSSIVTLRSGINDFFEQMFSEADGSFQFEGFDPGRYLLQADAYEKASAVTPVEVRQGTTDVIELVVRREVRVHGEVKMGEVPVAGARIYALPRNVGTSLIPSGVSDASGQFFVRLPAGVTTYDVVVIPRGFYVTAGRMTWQPKQFLRVGVGQDGGKLEVDVPVGEMPILRHAGGEFPLLLLAQESGGVAAMADGRQLLTIPQLESGTYAVCTQAGVCKQVFIPRFATATVAFGD